MQRHILAMCSLVLGGCVHWRFGEEDLGATPGEFESGRRMAESECATCHAVDQGATSPMREAPPFSLLGRHYPIRSLAEALAEGMVTGHDGMPEWELETYEIRGLLAYIQSVQR